MGTELTCNSSQHDDREKGNGFKKGEPVRSSGVINRKWKTKSIEVKKKLSSDFSHHFQRKLLLEQHCQNFRKNLEWMKGQPGCFPGWMTEQLRCPSGLKRGCGCLSQWTKRSLEIGAIGICGLGILCWASLFSCSVFSSFSYKPSWTEDIFFPHLYVNTIKLLLISAFHGPLAE